MKLQGLSAFAFALVACGSGSSVTCPTGWSSVSTAPGSCQAPDSFVTQTSQTTSTGVYGFVRTSAHGSSQLVVGTLVFALPSTSTTCDAASVNAVAQATTDDNGIFVLSVPAGDYRITSGEVPNCTPAHVDANQLTAIALTSD